MKKILSVLGIAFISLTSNAQLPAGTIVPNLIGTDINGNNHNLYDYLDQGYKALLYFSATWCGPCWGYHESGIMDALYNDHGPEGDQTVMVFFVEVDPQTTLADLYGTGPNTQGNWVNNSQYPIINNSYLGELFITPGVPTTYIVCSNRVIVKSDIGNPPSYNTAMNYFNQSLCQPVFECTNPSTTKVVVEMTTDNFPGETTWEIKDENDVIVASGGPYAPNGNATSPVNVNETHILPSTGCYSFHLYDDYGDGMFASQWQTQYSNGYCKVYGVDGNGNNMSPFYNYNGSYDMKEGVGFSNVSESVGVTETEFAANLISYPNPASDIYTLSYSLEKESSVSIQVINMLGEQVSTRYAGNLSSGKHLTSLDVSELSSGLYIVNLKIDGNISTARMTIRK